MKLPLPMCFHPVRSLPLNSSIHLPRGFFSGVANAASERNTINPVMITVRRLKVILRSLNPKSKIQSLKSESQIPLLVLINDVVASPNRQRHHRQRRILTTDRHETRAVGHEQLLDVPA